MSISARSVRVLFSTVAFFMWTHKYFLLVSLALSLIGLTLGMSKINTLYSLGIGVVMVAIVLGGLVYEKHSHVDKVTDALTRSFFLNYLKYKLSPKHNSALFLIELDKFNYISDSFGFRESDHVLRRVADRIRTVCRSYDPLCRFTDTEFALFIEMPRRTSTELFAEGMCQRILGSLKEPFAVNEERINLSVNAGVSIYPALATSTDELVDTANIALQTAKVNRTKCCIYEAGSAYNALELLVITGSLKLALDNDQLQLNYQPIKDLRTGEIVALEALTQWAHPSLGIIPPDKFIPLCEKTGAILDLTVWVIYKSIRQIREWENQGLVIQVSINISANDLDSRGFEEVLADALSIYEVDPSRLVLELTETAVMVDIQKAIAVLTRLSKMGLKLAIDDFGMGNSGLSYLRQLPVDYIKIDKSFITELTIDSTEISIVRSTINMAHELGFKVVAEGVETRSKAVLLQNLGCDSIQGYYLSKPVSSSRISVQFLQRVRDLT